MNEEDIKRISVWWRRCKRSNLVKVNSETNLNLKA